jgi:hypothetical protein
MSLPDVIGAFLGFMFTVLIFTYLVGDNVFFRLAVHVFVGVAAGFAAVMVFYNVIWYQLLLPWFQPMGASLFLAIPPFLLGLWLLMKAFPKMSRFGNPIMGYLVGAGAATAIGGAVLGTLLPQMQATINLFDLGAAPSNSILPLVGFFLKGIIIFIGTLATLAYFQFGAQPATDQVSGRFLWLERFRQLGQVFIAMTFGFLFAGVYAAALTALVDRLRVILDTAIRIIQSLR